jgi:hypothetical protein
VLRALIVAALTCALCAGGAAGRPEGGTPLGRGPHGVAEIVLP